MLARVDSVDETSGTCDVTPLDGGAQVFDVLLTTEAQASTGVAEEVMTVPKVGSVVVIDFYEDAHAFVACFGESETWRARHGRHVVEHGRDGLSVTRESDSLAKAIDGLVGLNTDLLDLLARFIVITPAGPSTGVDPTTLASLQQLRATSTQLKSHFNRLLK